MSYLQESQTFPSSQTWRFQGGGSLIFCDILANCPDAITLLDGRKHEPKDGERFQECDALFIHITSTSYMSLVLFPNPLSAGARLFRSQMSSLVHDQQHQNADEGIFRRRLGIQFFPTLLLLLLLTLLPSFSCPKIDTVKNMIIGFGGTGGACAFLGHFPSTFLRLFETISILFYDSD